MEETTPKNSLDWKSSKFIFKMTGLILLAAIVIVSILRDRIVNPNEREVSVLGQGKISYVSDIAIVTMGVQIDKANTTEEALKQLNTRIEKIITAMKNAGIKDEDIQTQNYSLNPHYDYIDGVSRVTGYDANQQLAVKVRGVDQNKEAVNAVVSEAWKAGINQVNGIKLEVSNLNSLKQEARLAAIKDAKQKSGEIASAAGVKLGKIVGWYENVIQSPDNPDYPLYEGAGGMGGAGEKAAAPNPQIPAGLQEIIIEIGLSYEVK